MPKASSIRLENKQSILMKGPFGFGKTLAAASFALEGPVYLSYWDKQTPVELMTYFTRERFGDKADKILNNIEFDCYGAHNANDYLNKMLTLSKDCRYTAVINDSVTFMTSAVVNWCLNFGKDKNVIRKLKDVMPDFDEYKVEASFVTQCLDLIKSLPCHVIWTAHPIPRISIEGSGNSIRVTKVNSIVSYGAKVGGIIPGGFTEIYHMYQQQDWNATAGKSSKKYMVSTDSIGDEFAKSPLLGEYVKEFDITDKLFYEVWSELLKERTYKLKEEVKTVDNPFQASKVESTTPGGWKI